MGSRIPLLVAATVAAVWSQPVSAAQYEKTGNWVFHSKAYAEDGDQTWDACIASSESMDGTELSLRLDPAADAAVEAQMSLTNPDWEVAAGPVRVRLDIGADHWVLPAQGDASAVAVSWTGEPALLLFLEDLASSSFAALIGRDGTTHAQFSLKGSRAAIEAMKSCVEAQIGRGLGEALDAGAAADSAHPF